MGRFFLRFAAIRMRMVFVKQTCTLAANPTVENREGNSITDYDFLRPVFYLFWRD